MKYQLLVLLSIVCAVVGFTIPTSESYKVSGLEKYGAKDNMYAGLMPLELGEKNSLGSFFFWLAKQRRRDPQSKPSSLIIWLNGGPGCSSMVGMMWENGPFTIEFGDNKSEDKKYNLKYNPYSWNEVSDVIFVEQPLRTGYATAAEGSEKIKTEKQVGEDFRKFLLSFLTIFPEYQDIEIYLTGESYAGFYIPWIANTIIRYQMKHDTFTKTYYRDISNDHINIAGVAIGNGVLDYFYQEPSYAEYAYTHGLIPLAAKKKFDLEWMECLENLEKESKPLTRGSFDRCNMMTKVLEAAGLPNEYDTSTFIGYDRIIKVGGAFDTFFQDPMIQTILHVRGVNLPGLNFHPENYNSIPNITTKQLQFNANADNLYYEPPLGWKVCNDDINDQMMADHPTTAVPVLQFLSDFSTHYSLNPIKASKRHHSSSSSSSTTNIRVLLYSGEFDLNCNTLGTLHTLEANIWRKKHWYEAQRSLWKHDNDVAGEYFTIDEAFSFLIVRNSGHLLPMDKPSTALEMITRFITKKTFSDVILPSESYYMDQVEMKLVKHNNDTFIISISQFLLLFGFFVSCGFGYFYYLHRSNDKDRANGLTSSLSEGYQSVPNSEVNEEYEVEVEEGLKHSPPSQPIQRPAPIPFSLDKFPPIDAVRGSRKVNSNQTFNSYQQEVR